MDLNKKLQILKSQKLTLSSRGLDGWLRTTTEHLMITFGDKSEEAATMLGVAEFYSHAFSRAHTLTEKDNVKHEYFLRAGQVLELIILNLQQQINEEMDLKSQPKASFTEKLTRVKNSVWAILIPFCLTLIGTAYFIGNEIGKFKYDQEKINLSRDNDALKEENKGLQRIVISARDSLRHATDTISKTKNPQGISPGG